MSKIIEKKSLGEKSFDTGNVLLLSMFAFTAVYPFLDVLILSLSSPAAANQYGLRLWPSEITFEGYKTVFANPYIWTGYFNTIVRTVFGTMMNVLFTVLCAYPLSKKYLPSRGVYTSIIVFTMFFSGGLIPNYLLMKGLGLLDNRLVLILPGLISAFTMIVVRNFFMSLPEEVEESAKIDGANDIGILFRIVLPVSLPIVATISLWYAVAHWNAWFDSLLYLTDPKKIVLGNVLRKIVIEGSSQFQSFEQASGDHQMLVTPDVIKAATIMVATIPIICVYPFIQKYFVKGVMVGSLKG